MQTLKSGLLAAAAVALAACSGGDNSIIGGGGPGGSGAAATVTLLTSSPQIPSDGTADATVTALVRDSNNNVIAGVAVVFTASSGSLVVSQPATTDQNGVLTATLSTAGDPTNRAITVSGMAGSAQGAVTVNVIGTTLALNGPTSLPLGSAGQYNVVLTNAGGVGIGNRAVTITSSKANGIATTPLFTDSLGRGSFMLNATNGGADTLTASALGINTPLSVTVSADQFTFTTPAANTEITLGSNAVVTVNWKQNGTPVANSPINFSTTRGTLSAATVNTDAAGNATVQVTASNAGPAVITATNNASTSAQLSVEFVATTPATLDLQAEPFTVPTNGQSALTATVRDANNNLVKNQTVNFVLTDFTGGALSVAQAITNSQGQAKTFYNASSVTSAVNGVRIDATVAGTAVTDFVQITVAQREVFISLGTGNQMEEPNQAQYRKQWVIQVTDAQGNGVDKVPVSVSILTRRYWDGIRFWDGFVWETRPGMEALPAAGCPDEDINHNGVLDAGEDLNVNGKIEAGNIMSVAPDVGTGSTVTTDSNGFALIWVYYPQEYAYWIEGVMTAKAQVQGTEFSRTTVFVPPGIANDFNKQDSAPPGITSPFGTDGLCGTAPPPDGP